MEVALLSTLLATASDGPHPYGMQPSVVKVAVWCSLMSQQRSEIVARRMLLSYQWGCVRLMEDRAASDSCSFPSARDKCDRA